MKILIHLCCLFFGSLMFVIITELAGFESVPYMGLIDFLLFYYLPARFFCKKYDVAQAKKADIHDAPVTIGKQIEVDVAALARSVKCEPTKADFAAYTNKLVQTNRINSGAAGIFENALWQFNTFLLSANTADAKIYSSGSPEYYRREFDQNIQQAAYTLCKAISDNYGNNLILNANIAKYLLAEISGIYKPSN